MHHKRKRPKNRRAGCLMCKPHKMNHAKDKDKASTKRRELYSGDLEDDDN